LVQNEEDMATLSALRVPAERLYLLGNGIDLERFSPGPKSEAARRRVRVELGVDDTTVVVGAVGRLVWEKGYGELFAAAEQLRRRCPEVAVVVAGPSEPGKVDGIGPAAIAAAESSGVRFLGHRRDVEDLYAAFDVYVLASHREGFPRSAMEAAAMGRPIVATDIRGCRQVVEDGVTGLLVPPHDTTALTDALAGLARDPFVRSAMGRQAEAKATREFDQRRLIALTLDLYERLIERKGRGKQP
jgi:glycosyltransferase involved in cell wall biosynthesis